MDVRQFAEAFRYKGVGIIFDEVHLLLAEEYAKFVLMAYINREIHEKLQLEAKKDAVAKFTGTRPAGE